MILGFWILDPLYSALGTLLAWFYAIIPSYGVAIILLTVAVRLVTFPLTAKQARSQQALQKLQPELKRLQAKYKNDRQKLNEEMMKFYRENKVNPFGGCLPLLIQMPILIVLYRLILGLSQTVLAGSMVTAAGTGPLQGVTIRGGVVSVSATEDGAVTKGTLKDAQAIVADKPVGTVANTSVSDGKAASAQVVNGQVVVGTITDIQVTGGNIQGNPKHVPKGTDLYQALRSSAGEMDWAGMDLAKSAGSVPGEDKLPYLVLIAMVVATGYIQQRQISSRVPKEGANQQMQAITKIFPIFFGLISFSIPAGVVVYFATSNIWQIGQQWFMFRNQPPVAPSGDEKKTDTSKRPASGRKAGLSGGAGASKRTDPKGKGGGKQPPTKQGGRQGGKPAGKQGGRPAGKQQPGRKPAGKQPPARSDGGNPRNKNPRGSGRSNPGPNQADKKGAQGKDQPRKDSQ